MRAVIDTNVLVSGLLWRGTPHALIEEAQAGSFTIVSSPALLGELSAVLRRRKFRAILSRSRTDPDRLLGNLRRLAEMVDPPPLVDPVSRDPDDDKVLAAAIAARADLIVSGDADLLTLRRHEGIRIVDPATALARLRRQAGRSPAG
ncbi:MAG: putative toxin-antitoxin system toxin component, PIN family [Hyphomicrobiales bacterium]